MESIARDQTEFGDLWRAWKDGDPPPTDAEWTRRHTEFIELLADVSGRSGLNRHPGPLRYLGAHRAAFLTALRETLGVQEDAVAVPLFRGIADEAAQDVQLAIADGHGHSLRCDRPASYTLAIGAARAFAARGHVDGVVLRLTVALDDVLFFDHERVWMADGLIAEEEVVVWERRPAQVSSDQVVDARVSARPNHSSRAKAEEWRRRRDELIERCPRLYGEAGG